MFESHIRLESSMNVIEVNNREEYDGNSEVVFNCILDWFKIDRRKLNYNGYEGTQTC